MITNALVLFVLAVGFVAIGILIAYIWLADPFKTALGSCLSSLTVLIGSLGVPDVKGTTDIAINFGFAALKSTDVAFSTGTPPMLWGIAFVSIVILVALFAILLFFRQRGSTTPAKSSGSIGGDVF